MIYSPWLEDLKVGGLYGLFTVPNKAKTGQSPYAMILAGM
jgi:hypothetical protein